MRKLFCALLTYSLLLAAGCGQSASSPADPAASEPETAVSDSVPDSAETAAASSEADSSAADDTASEAEEPVTLLLAAAASLEPCMSEKLLPLFEEQHPNITVEGTYDSSGKLQAQIESGMEADLFFSAATKQMDALEEEGLIDPDTAAPLLINELVLIVPSDAAGEYHAFADLTKAPTLAIGDPESVPAGQYAKEALTSLGLWDSVSGSLSLGTNVTEVLNWVAAGSAEAGLVYRTDAMTTDQVTVIAAAPEGSLADPVLYPAGCVSSSAHPEEALELLRFFQSEEAAAVFAEYGFTPAERTSHETD